MPEPDDYAAGDAPTRASASIHLTFGLVAIPLSVYTSLDDGLKVKRSSFTADGHEVGAQKYDKETKKPVAEGEVVMMAKSTDGTLVELTDEEQAAATDELNGQAPIEAFIPLWSIGKVYRVTGEHQARPTRLEVGKKKVPNAAAEKAMSMLCEVMAEQGVAALFKASLRGPAKYGCLTPDGRIVWLAYVEQVRQALPMPEVFVTEAELGMARMLLEGVGVSRPVLYDTTQAKIQAFVDAKAAGTVADTPEPEAPAAPEVDLAALLAASLAQTPAATTTTTTPAAAESESSAA